MLSVALEKAAENNGQCLQQAPCCVCASVHLGRAPKWSKQMVILLQLFDLETSCEQYFCWGILDGFSAVSIDSCFFKLQEPVLEGVDWGGEGRCLVLFYHSIKQGKEGLFSSGEFKMALQGGWPSSTVGVITCGIPHPKLLSQSAKDSSFELFQVPACCSSS